MNNAVAYMRCSGIGSIDGDTWDRQRAAIEKYATANDIEVIEWFRDEGISGRKELDNRPGLAACLERIENNGVKMVLVESADRLARDLMVAEIIIREFQKAQGIVIAASGGVNLTEGDDSNPTAKLIRQILSAISEFDRSVIVLKLRAARQRMRARGERVEGVRPFGSLQGEEIVLNSILQLRASGLDSDTIAFRLNESRVPTRSGKPWRGSVIRKILKRKRALPILAPSEP